MHLQSGMTKHNCIDLHMRIVFKRCLTCYDMNHHLLKVILPSQALIVHMMRSGKFSPAAQLQNVIGLCLLRADLHNPKVHDQAYEVGEMLWKVVMSC